MPCYNRSSCQLTKSRSKLADAWGSRNSIYSRRPTVNSRVRFALVVGAAFAIVIFDAQPAQAQSYRVLYTFNLGLYGSGPYWGVIQDAEGNLYGTTSGGGPADRGVVFELSTTDSATELYGFTAADGAGPAALIRDPDGTFFGNTYYGGYGVGTVYELSGTGVETVLHGFKGGADGAYPQSPLVQDPKGNLYGTTFSYGGPAAAGTVFEISNTGKFSVLYTFAGGADGFRPSAGLVRDSEGNLYGTTAGGGAHGEGAVFKLSSTGQESVLYSFKGGTDGENPAAPLIRDAEGNLYGTTEYGGTGSLGCGTVFRVSNTGKETVLHRFIGTITDGCSPTAGLVHDAQGNLYGTTFTGGQYGAGTIFEVSVRGEETILYTFTGGTDGGQPLAGLIQDAEGNLYGTTQYGGYAPCGSVADTSGCGVVFKLTPQILRPRIPQS
jgi:uncharacterized repeat protein (TIGR03803 family)